MVSNETYNLGIASQCVKPKPWACRLGLFAFRAGDDVVATSQIPGLFEDYDGFVEKFKPKKTTDDCMTPPEIYSVVLDYACKRYGIDPACVIRPFWPGGDYEHAEYQDGCVVIDNPPFSILAQITAFYVDNGVGFFLFAPALTALSSRRYLMRVNHILCNADITYENGAVVKTAFLTNLDNDGTVLESCPELGQLINDKMAEVRARSTKTLPKYEYPDNVITAAKAQWFAAHGTPFKANASECCPIAKLDAMNGKSIYGGGLLLSERAAAERAAAERAAAERAAAERAAAHRWQLSERERAMVDVLNRQSAS